MSHLDPVHSVVLDLTVSTMSGSSCGPESRPRESGPFVQEADVHDCLASALAMSGLTRNGTPRIVLSA
jgi:hypothetical protein